MSSTVSDNNWKLFNSQNVSCEVKLDPSVSVTFCVPGYYTRNYYDQRSIVDGNVSPRSSRVRIFYLRALSVPQAITKLDFN